MFNRDRAALRRDQPGDVGGHRRRLAQEGHRAGCSTGWARRRASSTSARGRWTARWRSRAACRARASRPPTSRARCCVAGQAEAAGGQPRSRPTPPTATACPIATAAFDGAFSAFCVRNLADLPRGLARAAPGGPARRPRRDPRVPAPRAAAALLRSHLQRARAAADRLGGHRRSGRLPLPARSIAPLPLAPTSSRRCMQRRRLRRASRRGRCSRRASRRWWWRREAGGRDRRRVGLGLRAAAARRAGVRSRARRVRGRARASRSGQRGLGRTRSARCPPTLSSATACATSGRRSPRARRAGTRWWSSPARPAAWRASPTASPTIWSGAPPT